MPRRYHTLYQCEHQNWEAWPRLLLRQVARPSDRPWRPAAQSGAGHTGLYQIGGGGSRRPLRRRQWPFHKAGAVGPGGGQRSAATLGGVSQYGLQRLRLQHTRGVHTEGRGEELAQPVLEASRQSSNTKNVLQHKERERMTRDLSNSPRFYYFSGRQFMQLCIFQTPARYFAFFFYLSASQNQHGKPRYRQTETEKERY